MTSHRFLECLKPPQCHFLREKVWGRGCLATPLARLRGRRLLVVVVFLKSLRGKYVRARVLEIFHLALKLKTTPTLIRALENKSNI